MNDRCAREKVETCKASEDLRLVLDTIRSATFCEPQRVTWLLLLSKRNCSQMTKSGARGKEEEQAATISHWPAVWMGENMESDERRSEDFKKVNLTLFDFKGHRS